MGSYTRRHALHRNPQPRHRRLGEQPVDPAARGGRRIRIRGRAGLDRGEHFEREAVAADADGRVEFGLGPVRGALFNRRRHIPAHADAAPKIAQLARLGVVIARLAHIARALGIDHQSGRAQLAFQIGRGLFERIKFGAGFVGQFVHGRKLGHAAGVPAIGAPAARAGAFGASVIGVS